MMNETYLLPKEIVAHLEKHIVGQENAKQSVAIALRNRWRRQNAPEDIRQEIMPNNIIMIGPTGVGKTEIARRLADLARDLIDIAVGMIKTEKSQTLTKKAEQNTIERLLDLLVMPVPKVKTSETGNELVPVDNKDSLKRTRDKFKQMLLEGKLDDRDVELNTPQNQFPVIEIFSPMGMEELGVNFQDMLSGMMPQKTKMRKMSVKEARKYLFNEEINKLINMDDVITEALERVQEAGIIFIDEIDKIVGDTSKTGPDVSRGGVQRDILPIVEGCSVNTKYGLVRTDHILFIAAGAFHIASPSDLIPELQGRFPIRVELDSLTEEDFKRILTEPKASLVKQYQALLGTENIALSFTEDAIGKIASYAEQVNKTSENIGARRLHTVMTTLLEDILFDPPTKKKKITITAKHVEKCLAEIIEDEDLSRYIL